MMNSPVEQIGEGQWIAPQMQVEADTKVMQGQFGSQTCLKTIQSIWTLTCQPEGIEQLVIDGLTDLTQLSQRRQGLYQRT